MRQHALLFAGTLTWCVGQAFAAGDETSGQRSLASTGKTGHVVDQESSERLAGVIIRVVGTRSGGTTDERGRFCLDGPAAGPCQLRFSLIGYAEATLAPLTLRAGERADAGTIALAPQAIRLSEVVVTPGSYSIMGNGPIRGQTLGRRDLENMSFAEYGDRQSGVFSMATKGPGDGQRHTSIGLSVMNARLYNLYNRENLRKFDVDSRNDEDMLVPDGQGGYQYFRDDTTWFGRLPVVGMSWEF